MTALSRYDLAELVRAATFVVDTAQRYDRTTVAYRIAMKRLEKAAEPFGEPDAWPDLPRTEPTRADRYALAAFLAVMTLVLIAALYGLGRAYGWWGS